MQGWMHEKHLDLDAESFIESYEACSDWIQGRLRLYGQGIKNKDLEDAINSSKDISLNHLLDANGGIIKIAHFFPPDVAEEMRRVVQTVPDGAWSETAGVLDASGINIDHHFFSTKSSPLSPLFRLVSLLMPDRDLHTFSAGRYEEGDFISRHDDGAYVSVKTDEGVLECSRDVALVYYLTPGWTGDMGGAFHDLITGQMYTPEFNSVVAFRVPRLHEVTKVTAKARKAGLHRTSLFGWFLLPGRQYELSGSSKLYSKEELVELSDESMSDVEPVEPVSRKDKKKEKGLEKKRGRDRKSAINAMWD
jgi:hypothetical protein